MRPQRQIQRRRRWVGVCCCALVCCSAATARAQGPTCTTQSRLSATQRQEIGAAAFALASAVQGGDAARVRSESVPAAAGDASQVNYLVQNTASHLTRDALRVTQIYLLDASARPAGDASAAEFSCPLAGSVAETDFAIPGLPPGRFAFVVVTAQGPEPWDLAFLLQGQGGGWRMAGFYPHAATAAGHDGLWYWTEARADAKKNEAWLAWLFYGEADRLLRPVNFGTSTNLEKLRTEQRSAAPQALGNGVGVENPLTVQGGGAVYRVTELAVRGSDDGKSLDLLIHVEGASQNTGEDAARNLRVAEALLTAHPELRPAFGRVEITSEVAGSAPVVVDKAMAEIPAGSR